MLYEENAAVEFRLVGVQRSLRFTDRADLSLPYRITSERLTRFRRLRFINRTLERIAPVRQRVSYDTNGCVFFIPD